MSCYSPCPFPSSSLSLSVSLSLLLSPAISGHLPRLSIFLGLLVSVVSLSCPLTRSCRRFLNRTFPVIVLLPWQDVWATCIHPDDHKTFFESLALQLFHVPGHFSESTQILKVKEEAACKRVACLAGRGHRLRSLPWRWPCQRPTGSPCCVAHTATMDRYRSFGLGFTPGLSPVTSFGYQSCDLWLHESAQPAAESTTMAMTAPLC